MKNTTMSNAIKLAIHKQPSQDEIDAAMRKRDEVSRRLSESVDEMMRLYFGVEDDKKGA